VSGLDGLRLKKAAASLRDIEQEIKEKQKWMKLLTSFKGNPVDARDLLEICTKITRESITLEQRVAELAAEARSLGRSISSLPPKQLTLNKYTSSSGGELKDLQAITARIPKQLAELRSDIGKFRNFATGKMNDPLRTSDGQPMDPGGMLLALLDLFVKSKNL
jgi:hypothetical protein